MREKLRTLGASCPARWVVAASVLLMLLPAPAVAQSSSRAAGQVGGGSSWPSHRPAGWSAGSIARGTGFSLGASVRVREVQRKLDRLGYGAGKVDGLFGPVTDNAVRRFQHDSALAVDGIVGPRTLGQLRSRSKRLERLLGEGVGFGKPNGSVRVRSVQRSLNRLGYGAGKVDGLFGPVTDGAVRRFQADRGLQIDGIVGPKTLRRLHARTESVEDVASRPIRPFRSSERQPIPHRPPRLDTPDAFGPPWEGQPFLAQLATITVLGLTVLLIVGAIALAIVRTSPRPPRVARATSPPREEPGPASGAARAGKAEERPPPIERVGARVLLSPEHRRAENADTVRVDVRLFVENEERHWETSLDDPRLVSVPVAADDLQERVRELVVPEGLPRIVAALKEQGIEVRSHYLEEVSFVVELTRAVERELLKARPNGAT